MQINAATRLRAAKNQVRGGFDLIKIKDQVTFDGCTVAEAKAKLDAFVPALGSMKYGTDWDYGDAGLSDGNILIYFGGKEFSFDGKLGLPNLVKWLAAAAVAQGEDGTNGRFRAIRAENILFKVLRKDAAAAHKGDSGFDPELAEELNIKFLRPFALFVKTQLSKSFAVTKFKLSPASVTNKYACGGGFSLQVSQHDVKFDFEIENATLAMAFAVCGKNKVYTCTVAAPKKGIFTGLVQALGAAIVAAQEAGKLKLK